MVAKAGMKQPGAPCPAPGAQVTIKSSRSASAATCPVKAADNLLHGPRAVTVLVGLVAGFRCVGI
ncbi:hypothetical protein E1285_43385 [Actinomadura sp. 7K507]|nr:hypothetical protein E1285_43385 [Actinomadura sp. 7K507]